MTNLASVRKAVIGAVPDIVELKFGCRIESGRLGVGVICGESERNGLYSYFEGDPKGIYSSEEIGANVIVLGRPIRLADVLVAVGHSVSDMILHGKGFLSVHTHGDLLDGEKPNYFTWNLRDDDLDHQSPETLQFLAKLLG